MGSDVIKEIVKLKLRAADLIINHLPDALEKQANELKFLALKAVAEALDEYDKKDSSKKSDMLEKIKIQ